MAVMFRNLIQTAKGIQLTLCGYYRPKSFSSVRARYGSSVTASSTYIKNNCNICFGLDPINSAYILSNELDHKVSHARSFHTTTSLDAEIVKFHLSDIGKKFVFVAGRVKYLPLCGIILRFIWRTILILNDFSTNLL